MIKRNTSFPLPEGQDFILDKEITKSRPSYRVNLDLSLIDADIV